MADEGWSDSFTLDTVDVGRDGLFLRSDLLFPLGQALEIELSPLGAGRAIRRRARVVRVAGRSLGAQAGFAVGPVAFAEGELSAIGAA